MAKRKAQIDISDVTENAGNNCEVDFILDDDSNKGTYSVAVFSTGRKYRFYLRRVFDAKLASRMTFIMLNPSTADAFKNDPTVARCQERAVRLGYGSFAVANIFAYRSTQPNSLTLPNVEPIGESNDRWIQFAAREAQRVMIGWGNHGNFRSRGDEVTGMLDEEGIQLFCLGQNKGGSPVHPLYQAYEKPLKRYIQSVL